MRKSLLLVLVLPFLASCVGTMTNNVQADATINASAQINSKIDSNVKANADVKSDVKAGDISNNKNSAKKVSSVTIYPINNNLMFNDVIDLVGNVTYSDNSLSNNIFWVSSNSSVIRIDSLSGRVTAVGYGEVVISAISRDDSTKKTTINLNVIIPYATAIPSVEPSYYPTPSPSYTPSSMYENFDIGERATFHGKVFNPGGQIVNGAIVSAKSIDPNISWVSDSQITIDGQYVIRNGPVGSRVEITVSKDGWTQKQQVVILKSNLNGDPNANIFDFAGFMSIQNEPEITSLKINNQLVTSATVGDYFNTTNNTSTVSKYLNPEDISQNKYTPSLTGINPNNLRVEMEFSEPVRKDDIENYFKIQSQDNDFIDITKPDISFLWSSDDKYVQINTNKAITSNIEGIEYRYGIEFTQPFRDRANNSAISKKYFNFSPLQVNDFAIFSVANRN